LELHVTTAIVPSGRMRDMKVLSWNLGYMKPARYKTYETGVVSGRSSPRWRRTSPFSRRAVQMT